MSRKVQICPVGFEFDRIIEGVKEHSCNIIYLLKSVKTIKKETHPNKKLIEIADTFVNKLNTHFLNTKICVPIVRDVNLVALEKTIEELCKIVKDEVENYATKDIWINIGTSTKLFVPAAMYVGAFYPKIIHLFYIDARHYTINLLLDNDLKKEDISIKYENEGLSYKKDDDSYKNINVPSYTMEILKDIRKDILITLKKMNDKSGKPMTTFMNFLLELGENAQDKTVKVRYGHHFAYLRKRNWVYEKKHGTQKKFGLTPEGRLLSIIHTYLKEEETII